MLAEIVLPAGKDRITISEIPALFANAIHPALPADTPRQITALKKYPLTEENSREWCGVDCKPFPVSLTADDMAELTRSVWIGLPPLTLPISEPEWQPYCVALEKMPPKDWKLKEVWLNRVLDARVSWDRTAEVYLTEVRQAAMRGHLVPRSSATLLPLPGAIGELLLDCFVTLENFMSFAAQFEIGVRVAEGVLEPHTEPVATKSASDVNWRNVVRAEAWKQWVKTLAENGTPTLENVAQHLSRWCEANGVVGDMGKKPQASYLKSHVIDGKHWEPPRNMSREAAKNI